eukprot:1550529-Prymnesium_polylepis.1
MESVVELDTFQRRFDSFRFEYNELQRWILEFFDGAYGPVPLQGLTVQACIQACDIEGGTEEDIRATIDFFCEEGDMYSTIDADHFLTTTM